MDLMEKMAMVMAGDGESLQVYTCDIEIIYPFNQNLIYN